MKYFGHVIPLYNLSITAICSSLFPFFLISPHSHCNLINLPPASTTEPPPHPRPLTAAPPLFVPLHCLEGDIFPHVCLQPALRSPPALDSLLKHFT